MSYHVRKRALLRLARAKGTRPETALRALLMSMGGYWYDARDAKVIDGRVTLAPRVGRGFGTMVGTDDVTIGTDGVVVP